MMPSKNGCFHTFAPVLRRSGNGGRRVPDHMVAWPVAGPLWWQHWDTSDVNRPRGVGTRRNTAIPRG
ncbi:protein of unknown function [Cupriavidus taiwanensis]|nr:protein of unknown function [Cupriavidus taiwanensis]